MPAASRRGFVHGATRTRITGVCRSRRRDAQAALGGHLKAGSAQSEDAQAARGAATRFVKRMPAFAF